MPGLSSLYAFVLGVLIVILLLMGSVLSLQGGGVGGVEGVVVECVCGGGGEGRGGVLGSPPSPIAPCFIPK